MKAISVVMLTFLCAYFTIAQKTVSKTVQTQSGQEVNFDFDHANVNFTTWNKNKISITGTVKINNGENDDAFTIKVKQIDGEWNINTFLENECKIPKMIQMSKDGVTTYKKMEGNNNSWNWNGWDNLNDEGYDNMSIGIITEINLEVKVPQNIKINITSHRGNVDIENFEGELYIKNTHGYVNAIFSKPIHKNVELKSCHNFVDVSIPANSQLDMVLKSSHGEILTDLDLDIQQGNGGQNKRKKNSCQSSCSSSKNSIVANLNGGGSKLKLKSSHNNIYLREYKMNN